MEVIFLADVPGTGRRYEIKKVSDGFARNFLIPRKLATIATEAAKKNIDSLKQKKEVEDSQKKAARAQVLAALDGKAITFSEKANEEGHLFAGITRERIAAELSSITGPVTPDMVHLDKPLKEIGTHTVMLVSGENQAKIRVEVTKED